jgi:hypothetical protein
LAATVSNAYLGWGVYAYGRWKRCILISEASRRVAVIPRNLGFIAGRGVVTY